MAFPPRRIRVVLLLFCVLSACSPWAPRDLAAANDAPPPREARLVLRLGKDLGPVQTPLFGNNVIAHRSDAAGVWDADRQEFAGPMLDALKRIAPRTLRFPGGPFGDVHDWKLGIGPAVTRGTGDFGAGPFRCFFGTDEFLRLCRLLGSVPVLTVNCATGTPEDAAAWVEYCNGSTNTTWGAQRAANGFSDPWDVPYWEIGSGQDHDDPARFGAGSGHVGPLRAAEYGETVARFAAAMKAADPRIKVGAVLHPPRNWGWHDNVLARCGDVIDFVALQYYYPAASSPSVRTEGEMIGATLAGADDMSIHLATIRTMLREHPATRDVEKRIQILATEWNALFLGDLAAWQHGIVPAVHAAGVIARLQNAGPATGTTAAHYRQLAGGTMGLLKGNEAPYIRRPAWFVFDWARNCLQALRCDFELATPTFDHAGLSGRIEPAFGFQALPGEAFVALRIGREGTAPLDGDWTAQMLILEREPLAGRGATIPLEPAPSLPAGIETVGPRDQNGGQCRLRFTDCRAPFRVSETLLPLDPGERFALQIGIDASQTRCAPPNLLANPGFENGIEGWAREEDPPTAVSAVDPAPEAVDPAPGNDAGRGHALRLTFREGEGDGRYRQVSQHVPVVPAGLYRASVWIRTDDLDGEAVLDVVDHERGGERFHVETGRISGTTGGFVQRDVWFRVPPGTTAVRLTCGARRATRGEAWFDDLTFQDISAHMPGLIVQFRDANGRATRTFRLTTPPGSGLETLTHMGCPSIVPLATVDRQRGRCAVIVANRDPAATIRLRTDLMDAAIKGPVRYSVLRADGPDRTNEDGDRILPDVRDVSHTPIGLRSVIEPLDLPPCSVSLIEFDCAMRD